MRSTRTSIEHLPRNVPLNDDRRNLIPNLLYQRNASMLAALSQVCSLNTPFETDVEDYAAGHCRAIDIWLTKLEAYVEANSVDAARKLLDNHQIQVPCASFQGGLLTSQAEARKAAWDLFAMRLDLCNEIGIPTIVLACDVAVPLTQTDLERAQISLQQAAQQAGARGINVALEFQSKSIFGNNLQTAAALVEGIGSPHLGLCLDVFHFYTGPSKLADLGYLTRQNLMVVQLSDLADVPREFATDADRIIPGDGDIPLEPIIDRLKEIEYDGCVTVELLNPQIWQIPPRQFGEIAITALRRILGQADMGAHE